MTLSTGPETDPPKTTRSGLLLDTLCALIGTAFVTRLGVVLLSSSFALTMYGERDLLRAQSSAEAHLGAELNGQHGSRTPGRLLHDTWALIGQLGG